MILGRIIVGALGKFLTHLVEPALHFVDMRENLSNFFGNGEGVFKHHLLRQIADSDVGRYGHTARCRFLQTGNDLKHGRLSGTVLTHKGNLVFRVYDIIDVVEKYLRSKFYR